jgi:membrane-associated HD superfamily phosphohydrolase
LVRLFSYTRAMIISAALALAGLALAIPLVKQYVQSGLLLPSVNGPENHMAAVGLLFVIAGFMTFSSTLVLHAAALRGRRT